MNLGSLRKEGKNFKFIAAGKPVIDLGTDFDAASEQADRLNAEIVAAEAGNGKATVTGNVRMRVTYRSQLQVVPRGQSMPVITTTQDVMDSLIEDWPIIVATFQANRNKVARDYHSMGKSVGAENAKNQPKTELEIVKGGAPATV